MYMPIRDETRGVMPPGHERWFAFDELVATCEWERGIRLRSLRDGMVTAQVLWYVSMIMGLWVTLSSNLVLVLGLGIGRDGFLLVCVPYLLAFASAMFVRRTVIHPMYDNMCLIIAADVALLPLLRRAGRDDYVLLPALEIIERRLAMRNR